MVARKFATPTKHYNENSERGLLMGTLKMSDTKQRHQNAGWKQRERNQQHKNAEVETARNGNNGTMLQAVENMRHEYTGKAKYRKQLIVKYS